MEIMMDQEALAELIETFIDNLRAEQRLYPDIYKDELAKAILANFKENNV